MLEVNYIKMLETIKNYSKCALENKVTLGSYLILGTTISSFFCLSPSESEQFYNIMRFGFIEMSSMLLALTGLGIQTLKYYEEVTEHINKKDGEIDSRYANKLLSSPWYCVRAGARLAIKENGLEEILKERNDLL